MRDWFERQGRKLGVIGSALAAGIVDFRSSILSDAFDLTFMAILLVLVWPFLRGKK